MAETDVIHAWQARQWRKGGQIITSEAYEKKTPKRFLPHTLHKDKKQVFGLY